MNPRRQSASVRMNTVSESIRKKLLTKGEKSVTVADTKKSTSKERGGSRARKRTDTVMPLVDIYYPLKNPSIGGKDGANRILGHRQANPFSDDVISRLSNLDKDGVVFVHMREVEEITTTFVKHVTTQLALRKEELGYPRERRVVFVDLNEFCQEGLGVTLQFTDAVMTILFRKAKPSPVALERGYLVLQDDDQGQHGFLLGAIPGFLKQTLKAVAKLGDATPSAIKDALGINTERDAGARLKKLFDVGLLDRKPTELDSGRCGFSYFLPNFTSKYLR